MNFFTRYARWLHTGFPAGTVENLPEIRPDGSTRIPGVYITGDLTGIPLLKFACDSGARVMRAILADPAFNRRKASGDVADLVIIGAGVSGMAAAVEARKAGLNFLVLEASEPFATIVNFPRAKPIYTYPADMTPAGEFQVQADIKETLLDELRTQCADIIPRIARVERISRAGAHLQVHLVEGAPVLAHRVIVAIGRSGNYRRLNVPGEELPKVYNRLHDPADFVGQNVLVIGGGDSAIESAVALARSGAMVTLCHRRTDFTRAKAENIDALHQFAQAGSIRIARSTTVKEITPSHVILSSQPAPIANDAVFVMIGREAPLDFFRRSGIGITGQWRVGKWIALVLFLALCIFIYHWKKTGIGGFDHIPGLRPIARLGDTFATNHWFPYNLPDRLTVPRPLRISMGEPGFYYSLVYCTIIVIFGARRIARRRTRYVTAQTVSLALFQIVPLFLLPYLILPWMGHAGWFDSGRLKSAADALFPVVNYGHGREYWRSFGLVLAWPLFFWNVFTEQPMWAWLAISLVQTCVIIPVLIYYFGKGAYCGWICSCGALAETLGDAHRQKMPHGPFWNRLNMAGQVILGFALVLLLLRILGWAGVGFAKTGFNYLLYSLPVFNYVWFVDLLLAGIIGVGLYFHFSGRVWCRFFCPLAALMHIYTRFSRFRIFADKKKCISCNVCTSVCHQGIDVMHFANRGEPMDDPQCVRCSACVQFCPTGVLSFGQIDRTIGVPLTVSARAKL